MKLYASVLLLAFPALWAYLTIQAWRRNIGAAKRSRLPHIVTPIYLYNPVWMITHKLWLPFLSSLPTSWTGTWPEFTTPHWVWDKGYPPFAETGDTFLTVAPGGVLVWTVDAEVISQICANREAFPRPLKSYKILEIFGENLISTEGRTWKAHRNILSSSFNEKNSVL